MFFKESTSSEAKLGYLIFVFTGILLGFVSGANGIFSTVLIAVTTLVYGYTLFLLKNPASVKGRTVAVMYFVLQAVIIYGATIKLPKIDSVILELCLLVAIEGVSLAIGFVLFQILAKLPESVITPTVEPSTASPPA